MHLEIDMHREDEYTDRMCLSLQESVVGRPRPHHTASQEMAQFEDMIAEDGVKGGKLDVKNLTAARKLERKFVRERGVYKYSEVSQGKPVQQDVQMKSAAEPGGPLHIGEMPVHTNGEIREAQAPKILKWPDFMTKA